MAELHFNALQFMHTMQRCGISMYLAISEKSVMTIICYAKYNTTVLSDATEEVPFVVLLYHLGRISSDVRINML